MKITVKLFTLSLLFLACTSKKKTVRTVDIQFSKEGVLTVFDGNNQPLTAFDIEIADTDFERQNGLMYRETMKDSQGMFFIFEKEKPLSFYMKNTYLALDILYINAQKEIIDIHKNTSPLDPDNIPSKLPAQYVLEIKAGLSSQIGIREGMYIKYTN